MKKAKKKKKTVPTKQELNEWLNKQERIRWGWNRENNNQYFSRSTHDYESFYRDYDNQEGEDNYDENSFS